MENLTLSFANGEIVRPGTVLELKAARAVTLNTARSAIVIKAGAKQVQFNIIAKDETTIQIPTDVFPPGPYRLTVTALNDKDGQVLTESGEVIFVVGALKGTVPSDLRAVHVVYLAVGDLVSQRLAPGAAAPSGTTYIEIIKAVNRQTEVQQRLAFDAQGSAVDPDKELNALEQRRFQKFGKLSETLFNQIATMNGTDNVNVYVWPTINFDLQNYDKPTDGSYEGALGREKELQSQIGEAHLRAIESIGATFQKIGRVPAVKATLSVDKVRNLAGNGAIGRIDYVDKDFRTDLVTSLNISRTDTMKSHINLDGSGVKAAIYESGTNDLTDLKFEGRYTESPAGSSPIWHPRLTSAIIKNTKAAGTGVSNGYAPKCLLYSANSGDTDAIGWAIDQGCTVISQSFHTAADATQGTLQADDLLKDYYTTIFPHPFFSQAAGNIGGDGISPANNEFVNHKTYNCFSVGNHDDTATNLNPTSVFRNPLSPHGDREQPEICANGVTVSAVDVTPAMQATGTSFATPAVAGVAVLLQQIDLRLRGWPEGMRAVLLAGAGRKISGNTWWTDVQRGPGGQNISDVGDGAGCLNAEASRQITAGYVYNPNNSSLPSPTGYAIGSADLPGSFDASRRSKFFYYIRSPMTGPLGGLNKQRTFKIALAWNSKFSIGISGGLPVLQDKLAIDLDLEITDAETGLFVGWSASFDNSYEVVEFQGVADKTYKIAIVLSGYDEPSTKVWYGLAWRSKYLTEE